MKEYRRVPLSQLRKRLQMEEYESETPFEEVEFQPGRGAHQAEAARRRAGRARWCARARR